MSETASSSRDGPRLGGVLAPVLTPFHADLSPDPLRLGRHCRWLLAHGCAALAPFGTTSEANSLSVEERAILARIRLLTRAAQPEVQAVVDMAAAGQADEAFERIRSTAVPRQRQIAEQVSALIQAQKAQAADTFGAEGDFLSAGKKLIDTRHPAFKAVTAVRGRTAAYWRSISLPYPEAGIRLIRQDDISAFDVQLTSLKLELSEAVAQLNERYETLKSAARDRLGSLYNPADYPESLQGLFDVAWDYPSVEPPPYLQQLSPEERRLVVDYFRLLSESPAR